jgi:hypothetical protein
LHICYFLIFKCVFALYFCKDMLLNLFLGVVFLKRKIRNPISQKIGFPRLTLTSNSPKTPPNPLPHVLSKPPPSQAYSKANCSAFQSHSLKITSKFCLVWKILRIKTSSLNTSNTILYPLLVLKYLNSLGKCNNC